MSHRQSPTRSPFVAQPGVPPSRRLAVTLAGLLLGTGLGSTAMAQAVVPAISIGNASVVEGNSGTTILNVPVTRTGDSSENIGLTFRTDESPSNPATVGSDYVGVLAGNTLLPAGQTSLNLPITINGDTTVEPDEQFLVHLLSAINAGPTPDYAAANNFGVGANPDSVAVGDLNGDGRPDLAVANLGSNTVSVLLNTTAPGATTASYAPPSNFGVGSGPSSVAIGDVNGDGRPDIAVANFFDSTVSVLLNTTPPGAATASYAPAGSFGVGSFPVSVAIGDVNGDGRPDIAVANFVTNNVSVLLNTTAPGATTASYAPASSFGVGNFPYSVAIGDLNGDGRPDLAVANSSSNTVSVLLNTTAPGAATASYTAASSFGVGSGPVSVAIGDVNGDGRPDLAVANQGSNNVSVLLNTTAPGVTTASYAPASSFIVGSQPLSVAIGDLNGDGRPDLAVVNLDGPNVSVLLNTTAPGTATPSYAPASNFGVGYGLVSVAVGDVNGDGRPDLAVANYNSSGSSSVSVLLNTTEPAAPAASFGTASSFGADGSAYAAAVGDLNGDGRPDLAVTNQYDNTVSVLLNTTAAGAPAASFTVASNFVAGGRLHGLAMGDLNGDGRLDIVSASSQGSTVSVLLNTTTPGSAAANFAAASNFTTGSYPLDIAIADFNGDGRLDVATANNGGNTASVLLNITAPGAATASFSPAVTFAAGLTPFSVAAGDLNGDGRPDIVVANYNASNVTVLLNTTAPGASIASFVGSNISVGNGPQSVALGDLNGDGRLDIVTANTNANSVSVLFNTTAPGAATPSFAGVSNFVVGVYPSSVAVVDLNGDGKLDLAVATTGDDDGNGSGVAVLLNATAPGAATASFAAVSNFAAGSYPNWIAAGDLNGDGRPDLASVGYEDNNVSILLNRLYSVSIATNEATATVLNDDVAPDTTPDGFSFTALSNVALSTPQISGAATISGINTSAPISVVGGSYSIGCASGGYTSTEGTITNGQTVCVQHTSSGSFSTAVDTTLTVGGVSASFTSTTLAADLTPNAFSFTAVSNVALNSLQTSNSITVSGINAPSPVSVSVGLFGIGSGPCTQTSGSVSNGDTIRVCHTASGNYATATQTTLTIGAAAPLTGVSAIFQSTTLAAPGDSTPDAFSFTPVTNAALNSVQTSNTITVSGINTASPISIVGGSYRIGSGAFLTTLGTVTNGQTVTVRLTASASPVSRTTATLSIGGVSADYIVVTKGSGSNCTPDPFTFAPPVKPAALSTVYTSNTVTIAGISQAGCKLAVSNGSFSLNGGPFTSTAITTVINGDTVALQTTSSSSYDKTVNTTFKMGGTERSFDVTTGKKPK